MNRSWEAVSIRGRVLRTFSHRDQAEAYRDDMFRQGSVVTVRLTWVQRRIAA